MNFRSPQTPGLGGLNEFTTTEITFVQNLAALSYVTGDILYYNGTSLTRLGIGSNTNVLTVSGGLPSWQAASGAVTPSIARTFAMMGA